MVKPAAAGRKSLASPVLLTLHAIRGKAVYYNSKIVNRLNRNGCVIVRIGVAFSGCDIGGICAWSILKELEAQGFDIGMISACCVPAIASLLYSHGCDEAVMEELSSIFLDDARSIDIDYAVANISASFREGGGKKIPLAINSVNVSDGTIVTFTDDYVLKSSRLRTFGIEDVYDPLSATISLMDGLGSYKFENLKLCDFCCWYGCPVHQLKLAGFDKIISVAFLPKFPKTPYEALVKNMISSTCASSVIHIPIEFASRELALSDYIEISTDKIKSCANQILLKTLF